jgi:hypothetical protein
LRDLAQKTLQKNKAGGVTQDEGPEFKPQYHREKKELWGLCWWIFVFEQSLL